MTEDEAKTKLCCGAPLIMAGIALSAQTSAKKVNFKKDIANCCASQCMAWRWNYTEKDGTKHGFCGLAGSP